MHELPALKAPSPVFSVVIPSFNQGRFLAEAIRSVLQQECDDWELIIMDGGSRDSTLQVISEYRDSISYFESAPDRGQSHALNKGIARARGEIIAWLNADDIMLPLALNRVREALIMAGASTSWLSGSFIRVDESLRVVSAHWNAGCVEALARRGLASVGSPAAFFSRELWQELGGFDETLHLSMDTEWWARLSLAGHRFVTVRGYLYAMRLHGASKTSGHRYHGTAAARSTRDRLAAERARWGPKLGVPDSMSAFERVRHRAQGVLTGASLRSIVDTVRWRGRDVRTIGHERVCSPA